MEFSIYQDNGALQTAREEFFNTLPRRPRCTENYKKGTKHRHRERAITFPYIQPNQPHQLHWLVFDVDHERPIGALYDAALPLPAWIAQNQENDKAHIGYGLIDPVCTSPTAHSAPIDYYNAVYRAMCDILGGDLGYTGSLTKNPLHRWFRVHWPRSHQHGRYELSELAGYIGLGKRTDQLVDDETAALGRNSALFETLRMWAYKAIRQGWPDYPRWHKAVLERAHALNKFDQPLTSPEVGTVARSVAKFTYRQMSPAGFSAEQARRGQRGGRKSKGGGRRKNPNSSRQREPWKPLGISRSKYFELKKQGKIDLD